MNSTTENRALLRLFRVALCLLAGVVAAAAGRAATLHEVANFPDRQVTGVAVSRTGRIFVCFPNWSNPHTLSVAEIIDGAPRPYPNAEWNEAGPPENHFVCVQSVYIDTADSLWILDPASPKMAGVVRGGPKLLKVDLSTNKVTQTIYFDARVAPEKSYLNDVRVDPKAGYAFLTESGLGAIIVVDLNTGKARRLLDKHRSTMAEENTKLSVNGRALTDAKSGGTPQIHADGIALDLTNSYLYYHALTGYTLYRIRTEHLKDEKLSAEELAAKVEIVGQTPAPDGMLSGGRDGSIYLAAFEQNAIVRFEPETKKTTTVITDPQLSWPDSLSWGPDGMIYVTASQIQNMPRFNNGESTRTTPYKVFKVKLP